MKDKFRRFGRFRKRHFLYLMEAVLKHWTITKSILAVLGFVAIFAGWFPFGWIPSEWQTTIAGWKLEYVRPWIALTVFVIFIVFGPLYYAYDKEENLEVSLKIAEKEIAELKEKIAGMELSLNENRQQKQLIERLTSEITVLRQKKEMELTEAKSLAVEVERWIQSGERIVKDIEDYQPPAEAGPAETYQRKNHVKIPAELQKRAGEWQVKVDRFVSAKFPKFSQRFRNHRDLPPRAPLDERKRHNFTSLRDQVANRVDKLKELLAQIG